MKKLSLVLTGLALVTLTTSAFGQRRGGGSFDIQLNIAPIAFANYSVFAGYNFEKDMTAGGVIGYQNLTLTSDAANEEVSYSSFYIAPEFRYYFDPSRQGNDGWYAGGYLKYRNASTSGEPYGGTDPDGNYVEYDQSSSGLALGIMTGRLWTTRFGLTFGTWVGLGYYLFDVETTSEEIQEEDVLTTNLPALDFRLGVNVGYRF